PIKALEAAQKTLALEGDTLNAAHARHLLARRLLLTGQLDGAERAIADLDVSQFPPASRAPSSSSSPALRSADCALAARERRSPARRSRRGLRALHRSPLKWSARRSCWRRPPHDSSRAEASDRSCSSRWRPCWNPRRWSWTHAATPFGSR